MDWLKKAPTALAVTIVAVCGVLVLAVLATYVLLTLNGHDTTEFRQWVNTIGQLLMFPLAGAGTVAAVSAARSASRAEEQTNGQLERRDRAIQERDQELDRLRNANAQLAQRAGEIRGGY